MTEHIAYKIFNLAAVGVPIILLMAFYAESYRNPVFIYYDIIFDAVFVADFLMRLISIPRLLTSPTAQQEVVISVAITLGALVAAMHAVGYVTQDAAYACMLISVVLRMHRLSAVFPQIGELFNIFWAVRNAFVSMIVIWLSIVIFYAVLGNFFMEDYNVDFGIEFLNRNYNFGTYYNSVVLLMALGTGNFYTEVIVQLQDGKSQISKILIEFYFISFYLIFNFIMVSFVVMLIIRYLNRNLENPVVANQQVYDFIKAWKITVHQQNVDKINYSDVRRLLLRLKRPLGLRAEYPVADMILTRFTQKVLDNVEFKRKRQKIDSISAEQIKNAQKEKAAVDRQALLTRLASENTKSVRQTAAQMEREDDESAAAAAAAAAGEEEDDFESLISDDRWGCETFSLFALLCSWRSVTILSYIYPAIYIRYVFDIDIFHVRIFMNLPLNEL